MKKSKIQAFIFALLSCVLVLPAQADKADDVSRMLMKRSNAVIAKLSALRSEENLNNQTALKIIQAEMSPLLDFGQLTKRAMGKHWRKASDLERSDVTEAFRDLLESTYAKVLAKYSGQKVALVDAALLGSSGKVSVVLEVRGEDGPAAEIDYIFSPTDDGYLIGDIKVEGISLVANYRRQFASEISDTGIEGLVAKLRKLAEKKIQ